MVKFNCELNKVNLFIEWKKRKDEAAADSAKPEATKNQRMV